MNFAKQDDIKDIEAKGLKKHKGKDVIVLAIPMGGIMENVCREIFFEV